MGFTWAFTLYFKKNKTMLPTLLHQLPLFDQINFTEEENKLLNKFVKIRVFGKREKILSQGEVEKHFNFIHKGLVRKYYIFENVHEINIQFATEGNIICSSFSYFSGKPSDHFVEAVETVVLLSIEIKDMDFIMSQGDRFTRLGKLLMTQLFLYNEERERDLLIPDAEMRIKYFLTSKPELARRLQQTYIASYLNVKPETFSRLKK